MSLTLITGRKVTWASYGTAGRFFVGTLETWSIDKNTAMVQDRTHMPPRPVALDRLHNADPDACVSRHPEPIP